MPFQYNVIFQPYQSLEPPSSILGEDGHIRSQSFLYEIQQGPRQKFYNPLKLRRCIVWNPILKNVKTEFKKVNTQRDTGYQS